LGLSTLVEELSAVDDATEMMRRCYGYGRWDAPYWFIGPEQGKGPNESAENVRRVEAWVELGRPEVCDCAAFHRLIGERRWHEDPARLQPTWRRLILSLLTFLGESANQENLRSYQSTKWGATPGGETCVIELSGLAVKSFAIKVDRTKFRDQRIETICQKIKIHRPRLVLMYGVGDKESWQKIAGQPLFASSVIRSESTLFALTRHPTAHGSTDDGWVELGRRLREC
jgi:hypothetical protein